MPVTLDGKKWSRTPTESRTTPNQPCRRYKVPLKLWTACGRSGTGLLLQNGVLHQHWETDNGRGTRLQVVLPRSLIPEVLSALHDAPSSGHLGATKTLERAWERFYWYGEQHDVEDWWRQYEKVLQHEVPSAARKSTPSEQLSRLPIWNDSSGHHGTPTNHGIRQQVHSAGWDYFSKWKEAFLMPNQEAKTIAKKLVNEVISRYEAPECIHSNQSKSKSKSKYFGYRPS